MKRYQTTFTANDTNRAVVIGFYAENKRSADMHAAHLAVDAFIFPEGAAVVKTSVSDMDDADMGKRIDGGAL